MRGIIRIYQNGNTVDLDCGTFTEASELFMKFSIEMDIPDTHMSLWTAPDDKDLVAERRIKRRGHQG